MNCRWLLVTDLDGTLLGNDSALERFRRWLHDHRAAVTLVYATGRTVDDVGRMVRVEELPAPDQIVGSVGSEIVAFAEGSPCDLWRTRAAGNWNRAAIRDTLTDLADLELQPDEFQSEFKISYYLEYATSAQIQEIESRLAALPMSAELTYSGNRFVDVLPGGMNKGAAVEFLAHRLEFHRDDVIACGDSGNDLSMFVRDFRAVLVANADDDVIRHAREPRFHSRYAHADGVLDGIDYWTRRCHSGDAV